MEYIKRHAEATVNMLSKMFGAILVAGPRQVGKTTMLQRITEGMNYATLDDLIVRAAAQEQSGTFFKDNPPPVFVDEIQKAPELFSQIKMFIDREHKKGQFFMCGSQQFQMMKGVSESLSGRIGLVTLLGFSLRERYGVSNDTPFLPTDEYFDERKKQLANIPYEDVWKTIHRGSMPELCENPDFDWQMFYGAYVRTYASRPSFIFLMSLSRPGRFKYNTSDIVVISFCCFIFLPYGKMYLSETGGAAFVALHHIVQECLHEIDHSLHGLGNILRKGSTELIVALHVRSLSSTLPIFRSGIHTCVDGSYCVVECFQTIFHFFDVTLKAGTV